MTWRRGTQRGDTKQFTPMNDGCNARRVQTRWNFDLIPIQPVFTLNGPCRRAMLRPQKKPTFHEPEGRERSPRRAANGEDRALAEGRRVRRDAPNSVLVRVPNARSKSETEALHEPARTAARFWTAPALWRFPNGRVRPHSARGLAHSKTLARSTQVVSRFMVPMRVRNGKRRLSMSLFPR